MAHWNDSDYFALLLKTNSAAYSALEYLVDDLHVDKDATVKRFLKHAGSEDFLWGLVKFIGNEDPRVAGNAAYILGTLAETDNGRRRVISLSESRHEERKRILPDLVDLLVSSDSESVMNAAGTIGTLAESDEGREWLLRELCTQTMLERVTGLLSDENSWTASNAALVLARITISEKGCEMLLENPLSHVILSKLILSLGTDEAGRGMNAAFAVGRLSDLAKGRNLLLSMPEGNKMISQLGDMLCSEDSGASKNACFAISCLAASSEGHEKLLSNSMCARIMTTLAQLLTSDDFETGWFAAMTLHTFSSRPKGCVKLRELPRVLISLQEITANCTGNEDMLGEAEETLAILKLLDKPEPPTVKVLGPKSVRVSWSKMETKCGMPVTYKLIDGQNCVYTGNDLEVTLNDLTPNTTLCLKLRASTQGDDSAFSDQVSVTTEEDVPGEPSALTLLAKTATQLKISWAPPTDCCGAIKGYSVYLDGHHYINTSDLSCIISGLKDSTDYLVEACASTCKGKGSRCSLLCSTAGLGDHCPSKPVLSTMGRSEISVSWNPPPVPLGRITRYEVSMNGRVIYSGTDLHCSARYLSSNTDYTFIVTVITNEGPQDSKPSKKRTAKDEFDPQRTPLYVPPLRKDEIKLEADLTDQIANRRRKRPTAVSSPALNKTSAGRSRRPSVKKAPPPANHDSHYKIIIGGMESNGSSAANIPTHVESPAIEVKSPSQYSAPARSKLHDQNSNQHHHNWRSNTLINAGAPTSSPFKVTSHAKSCHSSASDDRLSKTMTKLSVSTFEPMLPPSNVQRSATFCGQKKSQLPHRLPTQFLTAPSTVTPLQLKTVKSPPAGGRFVPMQYRGQQNVNLAQDVVSHNNTGKLHI